MVAGCGVQDADRPGRCRRAVDARARRAARRRAICRADDEGRDARRLRRDRRRRRPARRGAVLEPGQRRDSRAASRTSPTSTTTGPQDRRRPARLDARRAAASPFGIAIAPRRLPDRRDRRRRHAAATARRAARCGASTRRPATATVLARDIGRPRGLAVLPDGRIAMADLRPPRRRAPRSRAPASSRRSRARSTWPDTSTAPAPRRSSPSRGTSSYCRTAT